MPVEGDIVSVRETESVKPLWPLTVIVEVPIDPARLVTAVGFAVSAKS